MEVFKNVMTVGNAIRTIALDELVVSKVQRNRNDKHVAAIVKNFDSRRIGVFAVVKYHGKNVIIDGMHRFEALKILAEEQGIPLSMVTVTCVVYEARDELTLVNLISALNKQNRIFTVSDYLFSQKNVKGTVGYEFMQMLDKYGISIDKSSATRDVTVLTGVSEAFKRYMQKNDAVKENVENAIRLLQTVAVQKPKNHILTTEFTVVMAYAANGGDLKSQRVAKAVKEAGQALFILKDNARDVSTEERLNHFVTVLNSHM